MISVSKVVLFIFLFALGIFLRYDPDIQGKFYEADGYYWHSLAQQRISVATGYVINNLRFPPYGIKELPSLHSIFTHGMTIEQTYIYHGALLFLLSCMVYKLGGFLLLAIILYTPLLMARTAVGWNDTDIYVLFGTIVCTFLLAKRKIWWVLVTFGVLCLFWAGWTGVLTVFTEKGSFFPSGFATTAELTNPSWWKLHVLMNPVLVYYYVAGVLLALFQRRYLLVLACIGMVLGMTYGERFLLLGIPVWACTTTIAVNASKRFKPIMRMLTLPVIILLTFNGVAYKRTYIYNNAVDTVWVNACKFVDTLPKNAVIASWWSPGHVIGALGKRSVLFDGGNQHLPITFWIAKALITPSIDEARTILLYVSNFGTEEINKRLMGRQDWDKLLAFMTDQISSKATRPTYLLVYKEMFLNYQSMKHMAENFVDRYPGHQTSTIYETAYYKLFFEGLDTTVRLQYTYNDGKNEIKIWQLN